MTSFLLVAAFCCTCGAAEPIEASFCDMWPLAVGNRWVTGYSGLISETVTNEIVSQETRNGFVVWRMLSTSLNELGGTTSSYIYMVLVGGWLYGTSDEADLNTLPEIGGGLVRSLPDAFREGQTFQLQGWLSAPLDEGGISVTVAFRSTDVLELLSGSRPCIRLIRGRGPDETVIGFPVCSSTATIVGTCSGPYEARIVASPSQWVEIGRSIRLALLGGTGTGFQWYRDGAPIAGASTSVYVKTPAEFEDSGSYMCRISGEAKAFHDTEPVLVTVFPEGVLPVGATTGLATLLVLLTALGYTRIRRAHSTVK